MTENLIQAAAIATVGFDREPWQLAWSSSILLALVSLIFGLLFAEKCCLADAKHLLGFWSVGCEDLEWLDKLIRLGRLR